jgi:hypothetical protein
MSTAGQFHGEANVIPVGQKERHWLLPGLNVPLGLVDTQSVPLFMSTTVV